LRREISNLHKETTYLQEQLMISITLLRELSAFEAIELWYLEKQPTWKPRELSGGIRKGAKYGRSRPAEVEGSGDGGNGRMGNLPSPHSLRRYGGGSRAHA